MARPAAATGEEATGQLWLAHGAQKVAIEAIKGLISQLKEPPQRMTGRECSSINT